MSVVIYHNQGCGTSRTVLELIQNAGVTPEVVAYLDEGWTRAQLVGLFAAAGLTPRDALRTQRSPAEELGLLSPDVDDEALLEAMVAHPVLVNRPIVCAPNGVRLCRPAEKVMDLLEGEVS